jgi:hypothetical protein
MNDCARVEATGIVPTVFCIHSFSSSAVQYQGLAQRLGPLTDPDTVDAAIEDHLLSVTRRLS